MYCDFDKSFYSLVYYCFFMTLKQGLLRLMTASFLLFESLSFAQENIIIDTSIVRGVKQAIERTGTREEGVMKKTYFYGESSVVEESEYKNGVTQKLVTYNVGDSISYKTNRFYDETGKREKLEFIILGDTIQVQDYNLGLEQDTINAKLYEEGELFCVRQKIQTKKKLVLEESCDLNLDGIMDVKRVLDYSGAKEPVETIEYLTDYGLSKGNVFKTLDIVLDWNVFR